MTYTLRVSAKTSHASRISGIDTPVEMKLAGRRTTFWLQDRYLIIRVAEFATEREAAEFLPRVHAGLWNISLVQNVPFILEHDRGNITYAADPIQAGKNLAQFIGLPDDSPVHGLGNSGGYTVFRTDQNIRFSGVGEPSAYVASPFDVLVPLYVEAVTACEVSTIRENKTATAISLYLGQFQETSTRARLLTLMMVLEVLAPALPKHKAAVAMLEKMKLDVNIRLSETVDEEERFALESLKREFDFRRETSIRRRVRELIIAGAGLAHTDRSQLASEVVRAYDLRGKIVHTGVASDDAVRAALDIIFPTVKDLLRGRLGLQQ